MAEDKKWEVTQDRIEQEVREWCDEFEKSKEYKKLPEEVGQWAYPVIFEALQEGIDLADCKGMERFYKKYQARRTCNYAKMILAAKTSGRNDHCNCDSRKKYKNAAVVHTKERVQEWQKQKMYGQIFML